MSHDYHEALPGFNAAQVLIDGCAECDYRSSRTDHGISSLDVQTFVRAVTRAVQWNKRSLPNVSCAEIPLLETLWSVWLQWERGATFDRLGAVLSEAVS